MEPRKKKFRHSVVYITYDNQEELEYELNAYSAQGWRFINFGVPYQNKHGYAREVIMRISEEDGY